MKDTIRELHQLLSNLIKQRKVLEAQEERVKSLLQDNVRQCEEVMNLLNRIEK